MQILYVADVETTGTDDRVNEIIEASFLRLSDGVQKTFFIQPTRLDAITDEALKINGHRREDLRRGFRIDEDTKQKTIYEKPERALVMIEEFLLEDCVMAAERCLVGQNVQFDIGFLKEMWKSLGQTETYPFGRMYIDTMQVAVFLDHVNATERQSYHLNGLVKDFDVKKEKAHRSDADARMTRDLFLKLVSHAKKEK